MRNSECGILSTAECGCFDRPFGSALDPRSCALQVPGDPEAGQACALSLTWRTAPCRRGCHLSGRKAGAAEDRGSTARMPEAAPTPDHRHAAWARGAELNPRISPPRPPRPPVCVRNAQAGKESPTLIRSEELPDRNLPNRISEFSRVSALPMGSFLADFACFAVTLHCSGSPRLAGIGGRSRPPAQAPSSRPLPGCGRLHSPRQIHPAFMPCAGRTR